MKWVLSLFVYFILFAQAQSVIIDGLVVAGARSDLVSGYSYAPASDLALLLNADVIDEGESISLVYLGQVLHYGIANSASEALLNTSSLTLNGQIIASTAALRSDAVVYLPVRSFVEALGGSIDYVPSENSIIAVTPRADLVSVEFKQIARTERLSLSFKQYSPYTQSFNPDTLELSLVFSHANLTEPWKGRGNYSDAISLFSDKGEVKLELKLAPNARFDSFIFPDAEGFQFNLDLFAEEAQPAKQVILFYDINTQVLADYLASSLGTSANLTLLPFESSHLFKADGAFVLSTSSALAEGSFNIYYPLTKESAYQILQTPVLEGRLAQVVDTLEPDGSQLERNADFFARRLSLNSSFRLFNFTAMPLTNPILGQAYLVLELNPSAINDVPFQIALSRTLSEFLAQ